MDTSCTRSKMSVHQTLRQLKKVLLKEWPTIPWSTLSKVTTLDVPNRRVLVTVVGPNLVKNVFDQHFRYTNYIDGENGGQFWTKGTFDREAMARALEDTVAQVRFNVSVVIFRDTLVPIRCFYLVIHSRRY